MKEYSCTCPVCRKSHTVQATFLSSPRALMAIDGRVLPAHSCGAHSAAELRAARWEQF
jgi:hypothetical protein